MDGRREELHYSFFDAVTAVTADSTAASRPINGATTTEHPVVLVV